MMCGETELVTPTKGANAFYADNLEVEAGDIVGFYQPDMGALAFHLDDPAYDRGRGNLTGPVLFTAARASTPPRSNIRVPGFTTSASNSPGAYGARGTRRVFDWRALLNIRCRCARAACSHDD